jgi:hypothetical protein
MINALDEAQDDMRIGYFSGGAGILASSLAWMVAAFISWRFSVERGVWALFIGGMFIHPAGILICKSLGGRGAHAKGNPLGSLARASTFWLIFSLPLAYAAYLQHAAWFFPAMLLMIGGRYLTFAFLYGLRLYWLLGFTLAGAAYLIVISKVAPVFGALTGGLAEALFGATVLTLHWRRRQTHSLPDTLDVST